MSKEYYCQLQDKNIKIGVFDVSDEKIRCSSKCGCHSCDENLARNSYGNCTYSPCIRSLCTEK